MSIYYNAKRTRNLYDSKNETPFKLSRSKIDLFVQCPKCFYLDIKLGIGRPPGFPMTLNNAVDTLLKKEFDIHRVKQTAHPLMKVYGIDALPYSNEKLDEWRDALRRGISTYHKPTNFIIRGGIDDVWVDPKGELLIVDYKATSKEGDITLSDEWKIQYKRQMEIYQWLFRENGYKVSETGYFVYVNGRTDRKAFDGKLEFDIIILPYKGNTDWIPKILTDMKECLLLEVPPKNSLNCDYCSYRDAVKKEEIKILKEKIKEKTIKETENKRTLF